MTWLQEMCTPGRPVFWVILLVPNGLVFLWALVRALRIKWFLLVATASVLNIISPLMMYVIYVRGNGLNAPGTPDWFDGLAVILMTNAQTICLLVLVPVLIVCTRQMTSKNSSIGIGPPLA
jgi:hypothetical protein